MKTENKRIPNIFSLILSDFWLSAHLYGLFVFSFMSFSFFVSKEPMICFGAVLSIIAFMFLLLFIRRYNIIKNLFKNGITIKADIVSKTLNLLRKQHHSTSVLYRYVFAYTVETVEYSAAINLYYPYFDSGEFVTILVNPKKPKQWYSIDKLYQLYNFMSVLKVIFHINKK